MPEKFHYTALVPIDDKLLAPFLSKQLDRVTVVMRLCLDAHIFRNYSRFE